MVKGTVKIVTPGGLHMRPAGVLCKYSTKYNSRVELKYRETMINAKSVLSVLGACICVGDEVELLCSGADEQAAFNEVSKAIAAGREE